MWCLKHGGMLELPFMVQKRCSLGTVTVQCGTLTFLGACNVHVCVFQQHTLHMQTPQTTHSQPTLDM